MALGLPGVLAGTVAGQSPYREVQVHSCAPADSALGPIGDDRKADVRGYVDSDAGVTRLIVGGAFGARQSLSVHVSVSRVAASNSIIPQFTLFFQGNEARHYLDGARPSDVQIRLDDTTTLSAFPATIGTYTGPREYAKVPLSFPVPHAVFLQTLRAGKIEILYDDRIRRLTDRERRDLRGLFRVAVCAGGESN